MPVLHGIILFIHSNRLKDSNQDINILINLPVHGKSKLPLFNVEKLWLLFLNRRP